MGKAAGRCVPPFHAPARCPRRPIHAHTHFRGGANTSITLPLSPLSLAVVKINPRERPQERVLLITNKAVYNLLPTDYGKCKRRMPFEILDFVTVSAISDEFVLHCPTEYDYRLMSLRKREVIDCLQKNYQECTGFQLILETSQQIVLKAYCVTKAQAKKVKREPRQKRLAVQKPAPASLSNPVHLLYS